MSEAEADPGVGALFAGAEADQQKAAEVQFTDYAKTFTGVPEQNGDDRCEKSISLHLTKSEPHHSLWGNMLWNGANYFAEQLLQGEISVQDKTVLELGAGLGVPSILCGSASLGRARTVVCTDYPEDAVLSLLQRNVTQNSGESTPKVEVEVAGEKAESQEPHENEKKKHLSVTPEVLGMKWGDEEQMAKALELTGGNGFDVLILSDVIFNHVCHNDLAKTVAKCLVKDKKAKAYVFFTHYRPHKKTQDLAFFDQLTSFGLSWRQVNSQRCPLLFPEDSGDEVDRSTIHHYEISHTFDLAGPPLDTTTYDVLIQGTGLVECLVSASLARAGKKVLQVDPSAHYGGVHFTGNVPQFKKFIQEEVGSIAVGDTKLSKQQEGLGRILHEAPDSGKCIRDYALDFAPLLYLANSSLIDHLMESNTARYVEFMNVERLLVVATTNTTATATATATAPSTTSECKKQLDGGEGDAASENVYPDISLSRVPLKRADVFKHCKWLSPMEMRNLMKFVTVVETKMKAEGEGLDSEEEREKSKKEKEENEEEEEEATAGEGPLPQKTKKKAVALAQAPPTFDGTFHQMLQTKFKLSAKSINLLTLHNHLIDDTVNADQGIDVVGRFMSSVGRFDGETPFLVAQYGASELPQNMARVSAVWGSTFVLQRHVTRVTLSQDSTHSTESVRVQATLSNGQVITAKQLVAPRTSLSPRVGLRVVRAVLVLRKPFVSWDALQTQLGDNPEEEDEQRRRRTWAVPEVVSVLNAGDKHSVTLVQLGGTSQHAPRMPQGTCVIHLSGDESGTFTLDDMESLVRSHFLSTEAMQSNAIFASVFVASEAAFGGSSIPMESPATPDSQTVDETKKLDEAEFKLHPRVIPVQTMFTGFNDGCFSTEAAKVFRQVYEAEGVSLKDQPDFLEFIPEHPSQVAMGDDDDDARLLGVQE